MAFMVKPCYSTATLVRVDAPVKQCLFDTILRLMLQISSHITIPDTEIEIHAGPGAGGQHVNKVSSAIHLRFDIGASSLPWLYKERLLKLRDHRISEDGILTIKAQQSRSRIRIVLTPLNGCAR